MDLIEYVKAAGLAASAWKGTDLLKEIYGDALKPGVTQVGKALEGVLGLGNTALYPLHLLNARARAAIEANFERYRVRIANESVENVVEVPAEIGVPIVERLAYVSDQSLSEMYVELLAKASIVDSVGVAHPSFVGLVNALSPDEAAFLRNWVNNDGGVFVLPLAQRAGESVQRIISQRVYEDRIKVGLSFPDYLGVYVSNLEGLGVLESSLEKQRIVAGAYDDLESVARVTFSPKLKDGEVLSFKRGLTEVTPFGRMFLHACAVKARIV